MTLTATAMVSEKPKKDKDVIKVRCVPNTGGGECPANPAGGPRELQLLPRRPAPTSTTAGRRLAELPRGLELRAARVPDRMRGDLEPAVYRGRSADDAVNGATFGAPLPLLAANTPVCVVNRFASTKITGVTASIDTGVMNGTVNLLSDVFLTTTSQVCPRCSGSDAGVVGTCDSGAKQGRACTTDGVVTVVNATGNKRYTLSPDCPPSGIPAGTIAIGLPISTGTSTLAGSRPCPGQQQDASGTCGVCDTKCTGSACVSMTPEGQCVDVKGGLSQNC